MEVEYKVVKEMEGVEQEVEKNLLKFAVGHQLFCRMCDVCLDYRTAAYTEWDLHDEKKLQSRCFCGNCMPKFLAILPKTKLATMTKKLTVMTWGKLEVTQETTG